MKPFVKKHRIVLIALCAILGFGVFAGLVLFGALRLSMRDVGFSTVAEADTIVGEPIASETEQSASSLKLPAATIADIVSDTKGRRDGVIPHRKAKELPDGGSWTRTEIGDAQRARLMEAAESLTETLFGQSIGALTESSPAAILLMCFADSTGFRDPIAVITDEEQLYRLTLRAEDGALINADLLVFPEYAADPSATQEDALRIADALGMHATLLKTDIGYGVQQGHEYDLCDETGTCIAIRYCGDRLTQVAVYPNAEAMYEDVYFAADVRSGNTEITYPEAFSDPIPPEKPYEKHMADHLIRVLCDLEAKLSGMPRRPISEYTVTMRRDESGAREDVYVIETDNLLCTISAGSHHVMKLTCEIPCKELLNIPYEQMGGTEYEDVVRMIGEQLFSRLRGQVKGDPFVNAVYDDHACTMDVVMADETFYELLFRNGVLCEITYYATEDFTLVAPGWVADSVRTNGITREQFIPAYPGWDGDLHVRKPVIE